MYSIRSICSKIIICNTSSTYSVKNYRLYIPSICFTTSLNYCINMSLSHKIPCVRTKNMPNTMEHEIRISKFPNPTQRYSYNRTCPCNQCINWHYKDTKVLITFCEDIVMNLDKNNVDCPHRLLITNLM